MKKIIILFIMAGICLSCTERNPVMRAENESYINGQLCYAANPLSPEIDTVLCLKNVYICFACYNYSYCSSVRNLLSVYDDGIITECHFHQSDNEEHHWEYLANAEQLFYPVCKNQFISVIDSNTGMLLDSISLNNISILLKKQRNEDKDLTTRFYIEDFVHFHGRDNMNPVFIFDTLATTIQERVICFDGQEGLSRGDTSLTSSNPHIFN